MNKPQPRIPILAITEFYRYLCLDKQTRQKLIQIKLDNSTGVVEYSLHWASSYAVPANTDAHSYTSVPAYEMSRHVGKFRPAQPLTLYRRISARLALSTAGV